MNRSRPSRSPFDYTLHISRKDRHLLVSSPEFGVRVAAATLDRCRPLESEAVGRAVLAVIARIQGRLLELDARAAPHPPPRQACSLMGRRMVSARDAAAVLGINRATLRRLAYSGRIPGERTPGGHLRFNLEDLASYIDSQSLRRIS
jgi:excisionase family DNA binding protein